MSKQYGFCHDADRCIKCRTCELACKSANNIEQGIKWRKVIEIWTGEYPDVSRTFVSLSCLHCAEPACEKVCAVGAIHKREEDGIVVVDRNVCNGCGDCYEACPYNVPQFGKDGNMQKCDFCLERGTSPSCVASCPADALFYGSMEELTMLASEKTAKELVGGTGPSLIIRDTCGAIEADKLVVG